MLKTLNSAIKSRMEGYFQMKKVKYKPTNKERDSAIAHLFQQVNNINALLNAHIEVFESYTAHRKTQKKFAKHMEQRMEKQLEEHRAREKNEGAVEEDTKNEGQRTEGVRSPL